MQVFENSGSLMPTKASHRSTTSYFFPGPLRHEPRQTLPPEHVMKGARHVVLKKEKTRDALNIYSNELSILSSNDSNVSQFQNHMF